MQNLIILNTGFAIIQANEKTYRENTKIFLADYGKPVPYSQIDYNQTTKQCWLNGEAFKEYPNEVCEDILDSIDSLLEKQYKRNTPVLTLEELKAEKLREVNSWTASKITDGFTSLAGGELAKFDSDKADQQNIQIMLAASKSPDFETSEYHGIIPIRGIPDGETAKKVYYMNATALQQLSDDLARHIGTCKMHGWELQSKVENAQSKEELDAIVW